MSGSLPLVGLSGLLWLSGLSACRAPAGGQPVDSGAGDTDAGDSDAGDSGAPVRPTPTHPFVAVQADDRDAILARIGQEPWATVYDRIVAEADEELRSSDHWDHDVEADNAMTAEANAFLAWLHDDGARADRAIEALSAMRTDFDTNPEWDVNIRMPRPLICASSAWDLLVGGGFLDEDQQLALAEPITSVTAQFFDAYIDDDAVRLQLLGLSQNNHPIRTVAAVGVPALVFPDHPDAQEWLDFAASETAWLLGEQGLYIQPDGKVSEGPYYFAFGLPAAVAFLVAADGARLDEWPLTWDCRNRNPVDPWDATAELCDDGAPLVWESPLYDPWFQRALTWSLATRMPDGMRPPIADANLVQQNGAQVVAAFADPALDDDASAWVWDWQDNRYYPADTTRGFPLGIQTLARLDEDRVAAAAPPPWTDRLFPDGGEVMLRSGWDADALWLSFLAEQGPARKTLHDHVDGLSFSLAAYGEYLLIDTGYYKPSPLDNARTADAGSHNVVLVDGQGAPDKGLLTNWGDADAALAVTLLDDSEAFAVTGGSQAYDTAQVERTLVVVDDRYVVVADHLRSTADPGARAWTFRVHGNAGYDAGGSYALGPDGARVERELAGVDVAVQATRGAVVVGEPPLVDGEPPHVHQFDLDRTVGAHVVVDATVDAVEPALLSILAPFRVGSAADDGPLALTALDLADGQAGFLVGDDVVLVREDAAATGFPLPDGRVVETDARLVVWTAGERFVAVAGTLLAVDGNALCDSAHDFSICTDRGTHGPPAPAGPR
ncbi:MAG: heparinase II/III family protein [Alphaproteobacteria bacterium]|nr:heparinase II/III family protein [Alphaproteobacteria bacterium]